jgi:hypothetical protein
VAKMEAAIHVGIGEGHHKFGEGISRSVKFSIHFIGALVLPSLLDLNFVCAEMISTSEALMKQNVHDVKAKYRIDRYRHIYLGSCWRRWRGPRRHYSLEKYGLVTSYLKRVGIWLSATRLFVGLSLFRTTTSVPNLVIHLKMLTL